jgi:hypothetical protein
MSNQKGATLKIRILDEQKIKAITKLINQLLSEIRDLRLQLLSEIRDLRLACVEERDSQVSDELVNIEKDRKNYVDSFLDIISKQ